jgi:hypothetical protein
VPIRSHGWELNIPDSVEITFWSASLDRDEHKIAKTVIAAVAAAEPRISKGQRSVCLLSPRLVCDRPSVYVSAYQYILYIRAL